MSKIEDVKQKFDTLQGRVTKLQNREISLSSEVNVLKTDLQEHINKLLELTGKKDLKEAMEHYRQLEERLKNESDSLIVELDTYLKETAEA